MCVVGHLPTDLEGHTAAKHGTRGGVKVMPPFFLKKCNCNNNEIYMNDSFMFCSYEVNFPKVFTIFNTLVPTLSKMLCTSVIKFRVLTLAHITKTVLICCHLQNGILIVHTLKGQTSDRQRLSDLGCGQSGEEQSVPFCNCLMCAQAGLRAGLL
jgi:hypothetical protein